MCRFRWLPVVLALLPLAALPARENARPERAEKADWATLEGCTLGESPSNDGDSFHVMHKGKEYIFRLYFVDCPEENNFFPDRVADQARYFGLTEKATLDVGVAAAKFTREQLKGPFTVSTRWEDAKGSSQLTREFANITVNGKDLAELLVENGFARIYGLREAAAEPEQKLRRLRQLESHAKARHVGAWAPRAK